MGVLEGKVAVVTGSGRGIGKEIVTYMAEQGAKVVVNDLGGNVDGTGSGSVAEDVAQEIRAAGGEAVANSDSVATAEGGEAIFQTAMDSFGAMDILVNNAGILRDKTLFKMEPEDWDAVIDVHLRGHYCCTRPFAKYIRNSNRSDCRVINFSSVSGLFGNFGQANYGAAKAGIAGFTRVVALELKKYGATVNAISPGAMTRMTKGLMEGRGIEIKDDNPLMGGKPIARVATWLASPSGAEISGQIIHVAQGTVAIMQQPAILKSFVSDHLWEQAELNDVMPQLMEAKNEHDKYVSENIGGTKI